MNTPLKLLSLLGVWWLLLTLFALRNFFDQVEETKTPLTPEQLEEVRRLEEGMPWKPPMRRRDYFVVGPVIITMALLFLPFSLYVWLLNRRKPFDK